MEIDKDGSFDLNKSDIKSVVKYYSGQVLQNLLEKGGGGIKSTLHEFYLVIMRREENNKQPIRDELNKIREIAESDRNNQSIKKILEVVKQIETTLRS